jgi:hypothetical protein
MSAARRGVEAAGAVALLFGRVARDLFRRPMGTAEVGRQVEVVGYRSLSVERRAKAPSAPCSKIRRSTKT